MAKATKSDGTLLIGCVLVLAIIVMIYVVYNQSSTETSGPTFLPKKQYLAKSKYLATRHERRESVGPDTVAIKTQCVVTMPPAPARKNHGEKTALFSGNWFTENCPYEVEFDGGSFRGDPYKSRGQDSTNDWSCASF